MISRRTIFALLGTLLLAGAVWAWSAEHRDECSAWLAGDRTAPRNVVVETGSHEILVPCDEWLVRQTPKVQMVCLLIACGTAVFALSAWSDLKKRSEQRRW